MYGSWRSETCLVCGHYRTAHRLAKGITWYCVNCPASLAKVMDRTYIGDHGYESDRALVGEWHSHPAQNRGREAVAGSSPAEGTRT
jgi:hypothetical protein